MLYRPLTQMGWTRLRTDEFLIESLYGRTKIYSTYRQLDFHLYSTFPNRFDIFRKWFSISAVSGKGKSWKKKCQNWVILIFLLVDIQVFRYLLIRFYHFSLKRKNVQLVKKNHNVFHFHKNDLKRAKSNWKWTKPASIQPPIMDGKRGTNGIWMF